MSTIQRKPSRLVISFDVGTTFSGASYVFMIPGESPDIQSVAQFPGQQKVGGESKIPSVVCYDESGVVVAVGSEADLDTNPELAEIEGLVRAEGFMLHLWPSHLAAEQGFDVKALPPLPPNKTVVDIFGDILKYLYQSTTRDIRERHGNDMWESVGANIEFVLSYPNGWEGKQQSEMRHAAIVAGLVANETDALKRISFVTEGEASLHFCLNKIPAALENCNGGIMIVDCGEGAINFSTYALSSEGQFRETAPTERLPQGSIFVTNRARKFLTEKFRESKYGEPEDVEAMTRYFDKITKPSFKGSSKPYFIRFGRRGNDPQFDIRSGSIKINGSQIAEFFEPAVQGIIRVIEARTRDSEIPIRAVFMVGEFATSDYLFSQLDEHFKTRDMMMLRPDAYLNKVVAEGAISFYIERFVTSQDVGLHVTLPLIHTSVQKQTIAHPTISSNIQVPKRNEEFYDDHIFIIIRVEDELFKLPRYIFTKNSPVFRNMFDLPVPCGIDSGSDGSSDEKAFVLRGIKASEFVRLLRCLRPTELGGKRSNVFLEDWQSVLKLATLYEMAEIRTTAIEHMTSLLEKSPSLQIHLAKVYGVREWLAPGFYRLVRRKDPLDEHDVRLIGLGDALKVMSVREDRTFGSKSSIRRYKCEFSFSITDEEFRRRFDL